uniref:Uncharacterized protein n=1 Tax=Anguilla anguilla TaxID=7936 RepID=A0A0E9VQW8_ANGAN
MCAENVSTKAPISKRTRESTRERNRSLAENAGKFQRCAEP